MDELIVYIDKDNRECVVAPVWDKRKVRQLVVDLPQLPSERDLQRLIRGLQDGLAGASVQVVHGESEPEFLQRISAQAVPEDARDVRTVERAAWEREQHIKAAEATRLREAAAVKAAEEKAAQDAKDEADRQANMAVQIQAGIDKALAERGVQTQPAP